ncbi:hypothetical protein ACP4OV_029796 [Aristida adscensionis]
MARRKVPMALIGKASARARTFAHRKQGLVKKARELATLCDVDVAVVCAGPGGGGGGAQEVWASRDGVIERYRALPAAERARHTLLGYAEAELGKERAKLARVRQAGPGALAPWDAALDGMSPEELQAVLGSIDAAIGAADARRKALGLPADGAAASNAAVALGDDVEDMESWVQELMWDGGAHAQPSPQPLLVAGTVQPAPGAQHVGGDGVDMGDYQYLQLQMPSNGGNAYQPNAIAYPECGFQCPGSNYVDTPDFYHMQAASSANADDAWLNLAMWGPHESSCNAVVPLGYAPSQDMAGNSVCTPPTRHGAAMGSIGDNFDGAPAAAAGGYYMDANGGYGYGTPCLVDDFQCPDSSMQFGLEQLHYLSDVAERHALLNLKHELQFTGQ